MAYQAVFYVRRETLGCSVVAATVYRTRVTCHVHVTNVAIWVYHGTAVHLCNVVYSVDGNLVVTRTVNFSTQLRTVKFHTTEKKVQQVNVDHPLEGFRVLETETQVKSSKKKTDQEKNHQPRGFPTLVKQKLFVRHLIVAVSFIPSHVSSALYPAASHMTIGETRQIWFFSFAVRHPGVGGFLDAGVSV